MERFGCPGVTRACSDPIGPKEKARMLAGLIGGTSYLSLTVFRKSQYRRYKRGNDNDDYCQGIAYCLQCLLAGRLIFHSQPP